MSLNGFFEVIKSTLTYNIPLGVLVLFFICYIYHSGRKSDRKILADYANDRKALLNEQREMYKETIKIKDKELLQLKKIQQITTYHQ